MAGARLGGERDADGCTGHRVAPPSDYGLGLDPSDLGGRNSDVAKPLETAGPVRILAQSQESWRGAEYDDCDGHYRRLTPTPA